MHSWNGTCSYVGDLLYSARAWEKLKTNKQTTNDLKPKGQPLEEKCCRLRCQNRDPHQPVPLQDCKFGNTALTSESLQLLSSLFHRRANPKQKRNPCYQFWVCPHVHPRAEMVMAHKANPSNALWLGAGGFVRRISPSLSLFTSLVKAIWQP